MDMFEQFKSFMRDGERYIVVENGEPQYVVMSFNDYRELLAAGPKKTGSNPFGTSGREWERANAEFAPSLEPVSEPIDPATVRLEDLPL